MLDQTLGNYAAIRLSPEVPPLYTWTTLSRRVRMTWFTRNSRCTIPQRGLPPFLVSNFFPGQKLETRNFRNPRIECNSSWVYESRRRLKLSGFVVGTCHPRSKTKGQAWHFPSGFRRWKSEDASIVTVREHVYCERWSYAWSLAIVHVSLAVDSALTNAGAYSPLKANQSISRCTVFKTAVTLESLPPGQNNFRRL